MWTLRVQVPRIRKVSVLRLLIVRECCMLSVGKHSDNSNNNVHCESPYVTMMHAFNGQPICVIARHSLFGGGMPND